MSRPSQAMKTAERAIENLFSDTAVPAEKTMEYLNDLSDDINYKINAIREDLKRKAKPDES